MKIYGIMERLFFDGHQRLFTLNKDYFFQDKEVAEIFRLGLQEKFNLEKDGSCELEFELVELNVR